jgi:hypothetical protein
MQCQAFAQLKGVCTYYDPASGEGRVACSLPNPTAGGQLEVGFVVQAYITSAADPPTPYVNQAMIVEIMITPMNGAYWAGSVRDYRGYTSQLQNLSSVGSAGFPVGQFPPMGMSLNHGAHKAGLADYKAPKAPKQRNSKKGKQQPGGHSHAQTTRQQASYPRQNDSPGLLHALYQMAGLTVSPEPLPLPIGINHSAVYSAPSMATEPTSEHYHEIITLLRGVNGLNFVGDGIGMLSRTQPTTAESLWNHDPETRRTMLITFLSYAMEQAGTGQSNGNSGRKGVTTPPPAPISPPRPTQPTTFHCSICLDDEPIHDIFVVSECEHSFCRGTIKEYILGQLDVENVTPRCPACMETIISDADMSLVLTPDELRRYYDLSLHVAADDAPYTHKCLVESCRGVAWLNRGDTHFRCPIPACRAERCVSCNTREWHAEQTCEEVQQHLRNNDLQPEQLRDLFQGTAYMCGQCGLCPVLHGYCANLQTHHGEAQGQARINNACQDCGWFSASISDWPRWDGQVRQRQ